MFQQRGLARAGFTHQPENGTLRHRKSYVPQGLLLSKGATE